MIDFTTIHLLTGEAGEKLLDHGRQFCYKRTRRGNKSSFHELATSDLLG